MKPSEQLRAEVEAGLPARGVHVETFVHLPLIAALVARADGRIVLTAAELDRAWTKNVRLLVHTDALTEETVIELREEPEL